MINKNRFNKNHNDGVCIKTRMPLPCNIDNVISPSSLRADPLEELLQGGNQQGGLALPEEVHEHNLLLQGQVQQAQAVQHRRLQVLLT